MESLLSTGLPRLVYDCLNYILLFRIGRAVKVGEEDDDLIN